MVYLLTSGNVPQSIPCWRSLDWFFRISDQSVIYNIFPNLQKRLCSYRRMVRWSPITSIQSCSRLIVNTIAQRRPCSKSWTMFFWKWTRNTWPCWSFWIIVRRLTRSIIPSCWISWPRLLACRVKHTTGSARTCLVGVNESKLMDQCQRNFLWTAVFPRVPA